MNIVCIIGRPTREYESSGGFVRFRVLVEVPDREPVTVNVQPTEALHQLFREARVARLMLAIDGSLAQVDDGHATVLAEHAVLIRPQVDHALAR